jgi:hypothetical protein
VTWRILAAIAFFVTLVFQLLAFPIVLYDGLTPDHIPWLAKIAWFGRCVLAPSEWIAKSIIGDGYGLIHLTSAWFIVAIISAMPCFLIGVVVSRKAGL